MKKFKAEINVMPLEALLDPQGKAVTSSLNSLSIGAIANVRVGKHMSLFVEAADHAAAENIVDQACKKLLCNEIMEYFTFTVLEA
jgi:phosphoribosylformylglycinamidine synthase